MKSITSSYIIFSLIISTLTSFGQSKLIDDEVIKTNDGTKNYIIGKRLSIQPPNSTEGVVFTATSSVSFVFKMANPNALYFPPGTDQNFVRTETILAPGVTDENTIRTLSLIEKNTAYEYVDGLGRKLQSVALKNSPTLNDLIVPFAYEANTGRVRFEYLPFTASGNGGFNSSNENGTTNFYANPPSGICNDTRPFNENVYESSPLNRVTDVYGAGLDWKNGTVDRGSKAITRLNTSSENVVRWKYFISGLPERDAAYPDNQLMVQETMDEEGQVTKVYKNLRDQVVLSRVGKGAEWFDTHYIYSPSGLLMIVIQPEGSFRLASEFDSNKQLFLNRWCFQYKYDDEQRMIEKRVPGWEPGYWASTVYDKWNRVVFTQTPAQKASSQWLFYKYDNFNRTIITGLYGSSLDRTSLQNVVNSFYTTNPENRFEGPASNSTGFTLNVTYPQNPSEGSLLSVVYYDNYNFRGQSGWDSEASGTNYQFANVSGFPQYNADPLVSPILHVVKGYATGSKVRILGQSRWLNSVTYYDRKYRVIQTIAENHKNGHDRVTSEVDFTGKTLKTQLFHSSEVATVTTVRSFTYDHAGRLMKLHQSIDGGAPVLLASNVYNEIGQLIEKNIHSTNEGASFLQSIDYRYNIRGWLISINNSSLTNDGSKNNDGNDLFGMELLYNQVSAPTVYNNESGTISSYSPPKLYDGNITAIKWKTDTKETTPGYVPKEKIYGFEYDVLDRFKKSWYATNNSGTWDGDAGIFNESVEQTSAGVTSHYDRNGNIKGIKRFGRIDGAKNLIDQTTYNYNYNFAGANADLIGESNRLIGIQDDGNDNYGFKDKLAQTSEEFRYDKSGNLIYDLHKEISNITYNHLNLPEVITFTRPSGQVDQITYSYDANGTKLSTVVHQNGTQVWRTDYVGETQYDTKINESSQLTFVATPEGRMIRNGLGFDYEYFHKDHQGNVRATYGQLKETVSFRATMEDPASPSTVGNDEEAIFANVDDTRHHNGVGENYNVTKSSEIVLSPDASAHTNGYTAAKRVGPAKKIRLLSGDKVQMEVFAKYTVQPQSASIIEAALLVSAVTGTFNITPGETPGLYSGFNNNVGVIPGSGSASSTLPKAYLAFLFFNDNDVFVTSGAVPISTSAHNAFEKLERTFTAPQNGNIYVYVANESNVNEINGSVYFDEMLIVHQKNNNALQVTQASDYYPFGLTFNNYQAQRISEDFRHIHKNRYGFQGQELQKDLDLGWSQFKWRMHDPAIGRFGGVDPLSDKYLHNSTYAFSENKLIRHIELEGLESVDFSWIFSLINKMGLNPDNPPESVEQAARQENMRQAWNKVRSDVHQMREYQREGFDLVPIAGPLTNALIDGKSGAKSGGEIAGDLALEAGFEMFPWGKLGDALGFAAPGAFRRLESLGKASQEKVDEFAAVFKDLGNWGDFDPIKVFEHNGNKYVLDGHHRLAAARKANIDVVYETVPLESIHQYGYENISDIIAAWTTIGPDKIKF